MNKKLMESEFDRGANISKRLKLSPEQIKEIEIAIDGKFIGGNSAVGYTFLEETLCGGYEIYLTH